MSPEAQRIAIAEACGWKNARGYWGIPPEGGRRFPYSEHHEEDWRLKPFLGLPDYLNDLNAMHEATQSLTKDQLRWYRNLLIEMTGTFEAVDATAAQRAEAFLRAIGKWDNTSVKEAQP